ncbi:MAG: WD40 repeat domain-containing protein [Gemmataceae bacterium]
MIFSYACSQGHQWHLNVADQLPANDLWILCPVCGAKPVPSQAARTEPAGAIDVEPVASGPNMELAHAGQPSEPVTAPPLSVEPVPQPYWEPRADEEPAPADLNDIPPLPKYLGNMDRHTPSSHVWGIPARGLVLGSVVVALLAVVGGIAAALWYPGGANDAGSRSASRALAPAAETQWHRDLERLTDALWEIDLLRRQLDQERAKTRLLLHQRRPESFLTLKDQDTVSCLAPSPLGARLASAGDNRVIIWDSLTGEKLRTLKGHHVDVLCVAYGSNGIWLATGGADHQVKLWNTDEGREAHTFKGHSDRVSCVGFEPTNRLLASGSRDKTIRLWNMETMQFVKSLAGHGAEVCGVAFSPNGQRLASASADGTARIWDVASGQTLHTLKGHTSQVMCVAWSPDGRRIATGGEDDTLILWDADTGAKVRLIKGHSNEIRGVAFCPDSRRLASGSADQRVNVWDVNTGAMLFTHKGHLAEVTSVAFEGQRIASSDASGVIHVWKLEN